MHQVASAMSPPYPPFSDVTNDLRPTVNSLKGGEQNFISSYATATENLRITYILVAGQT